MNDYLDLKTHDNHSFQAYISYPDEKPKSGLVVIQEIFGVNQHIREVCDFYATKGYLTIAPCLFDRENKKIQLTYKVDDVQKGRKLKEKINDLSLNEIEACISHILPTGKIGIIGFCWGGSLAWKSANKFQDLSSAIVYYGGEVPKLNTLTPKCPVICHFGELDKSIPIIDVKKFKKIRTEVEVYIYLADHGFNCNHRSQFNEKCANLATDRTLKFLEKNLT